MEWFGVRKIVKKSIPLGTELVGLSAPAEPKFEAKASLSQFLLR